MFLRGSTSAATDSNLRRATSFIAIDVRLRPAASSIDVGARANADSNCSSRASGAAREARIAFVPSAVARLLGDYVAFACRREAARAQWLPVRVTSNKRWRGPGKRGLIGASGAETFCALGASPAA